MFHNPARFTARTLTFAWAAFWTYFMLASAFVEGASPTTRVLACTIGIGFFLSHSLLVWLFEHAASVVLSTEGVILTFLNYAYLHNPASTQLFLLLTLCVPPIAAGLALVSFKPTRHVPG